MSDSGPISYHWDRKSSSSADDGTPAKKSMTLLIATTSIAGSILLIFLLYVVIQMRRGIPFVDIVKLRRHTSSSNPYFVHSRSRSKAEEEGIHFEQRYSVRSARYQASIRSRKNVPAVPSAKTMPSSKPSSIIMEPHMAYLKGSGRKPTQDDLTREMSRKSMVPTISVRSIGDEPMSPISQNGQQTRWSWTNSEAPTTPRLNMERKRTSSSTGSLAPHYKPESTFSDAHMERKRASLISTGSMGSIGPHHRPASTLNDHRMAAIEEDRVPSYSHQSLPSDKAQEILETGGSGYHPPRPLPKALDKSSFWMPFRRNE